MGFAEEALVAHNEYRAKHGVEKLKLDKQIVGIAQKWAEHLASTGTFSHSQERDFKGQRMGENIAMKWTSSGDDFTGGQVTEQWYSEVSKYDFAKNAGGGTGHFTQVVWRASTEFGIGKAQGKDGKWIVVANYAPAGNVLGRFAENVFPEGGGPGKASRGGLFKGRKSPAASKPDKYTISQPKPTAQPTSRSASQPAASHTTTKVISHQDRHRPVGGAGGGNGMWFEKPGSMTATSYSRTVVTSTTIGPDGKKTVTTTETRRDGAPATSRFGTRTIEHHMGPNTNNNSNARTQPARPMTLEVVRKETAEERKESQSVKDFSNDVVKVHNKYRKQHKAGPVKLSRGLSALAQQWAASLAQRGRQQPSGHTYKGQPLGESLAVRWKDQYTGSEVCDKWYGEKDEYNFSSATHSPRTQHFSQMVWKQCRKIGVGKAQAADGRVYVVCYYSPAGNVDGQFSKNVFPAK